MDRGAATAAQTGLQLTLVLNSFSPNRHAALRDIRFNYTWGRPRRRDGAAVPGSRSIFQLQGDQTSSGAAGALTA